MISSLSIASLCLNTVFGYLTFSLNFFGLISISLYSRKVFAVMILSLNAELDRLELIFQIQTIVI
jgi:hypothetical protein